jgi:hypothetical protein
VEGDCVYAVAAASNTCSNEGEAVIQIPVSVRCPEEVQQPYAIVPHLMEEQLTLPAQHYSHDQTQHCTKVRDTLRLPDIEHNAVKPG